MQGVASVLFLAGGARTLLTIFEINYNCGKVDDTVQKLGRPSRMPQADGLQQQQLADGTVP
jgi:hypothetical protein